LGQKIKAVIAIIIVGFVGFILGAVANLMYFQFIPLLMEFFPRLFSAEWFLWGLIGALLAVVCCLIYAYLP
jgi:ABC-type antimicrobial peptide transport system permease subunit